MFAICFALFMFGTLFSTLFYMLDKDYIAKFFLYITFSGVLGFFTILTITLWKIAP